MSPLVLTNAYSPAFLASLLSGIIVVLFILRKLYIAITNPLRKVPGPFYSHFTHLRLKGAVVSGSRTQYIHSLHQRYGPLVRISPTEVSCSDAEASRIVHRPGSGFSKSPWYQKFVNHTSPGIFDMSDTKMHSARRKLLARAFSKSDIRTRWEGMVRKKASLAVQKLGEELVRKGEVDVLKWWTFMATDVSAHLMFGESFQMLEYGEKNEYIHVLESTTKGSGIMSEFPLVGVIGRRIPLEKFQNTFNANSKLLQYGSRAIAAGRALGSGQGASIFAQLDPAEQTKSAYPLTEHDICVEAGNFILAGSDTTAVTLTYLTWAVLSHPDVQKELETEVAGLSEDFADADLEQLPLLNAVVNETLRLYGAAPGSLPRTVPRSGAQLAGYYVPEGCTVSTQAWSLHRDATLWPNPERFDPHRWLTLPPSTSPTSPTFYAFGAGVRICLGLHLALMELRVATALFFRTWNGAKLSDQTTPKSMDVVNFFLIRPRDDRCYIKL